MIVVDGVVLDGALVVDWLGFEFLHRSLHIEIKIGKAFESTTCFIANLKNLKLKSLLMKEIA